MLKYDDISTIDTFFTDPNELELFVDPVTITAVFFNDHKLHTKISGKKFLEESLGRANYAGNKATIEGLKKAENDLEVRKKAVEDFLQDPKLDNECKRLEEIITNLKQNLVKQIDYTYDQNYKITDKMQAVDARTLASIVYAASFEALIANPDIINAPQTVKDSRADVINHFKTYYGIDDTAYKTLCDAATNKTNQDKIINDNHIKLRNDLALLNRFKTKDNTLGFNFTNVKNDPLLIFLEELKVTPESVKRDIKNHKDAADRPVFPGAANLANNSAVSLAQAANAGNAAALAEAELAKQLALHVQQERKNMDDARAAAEKKELEDALAASLKNDAAGEPEDPDFAAAIAASAAEEKRRNDQEQANQQRILDEIAANNAKRLADQRAKQAADELARRAAAKQAEENARRLAEENAKKAVEENNRKAAEENARRQADAAAAQAAQAAAAHRAMQEQIARDNARIEQARRDAAAREAAEKERAAQAAQAAAEKAKAEREAKARIEREAAEKARAAQVAAQKAAEDKARIEREAAEKARAAQLAAQQAAAQQAANRAPANQPQQPAANPPAAQPMVVNRAPQQPAANPNAAAVNPAAAPNQPPPPPATPASSGKAAAAKIKWKG